MIPTMTFSELAIKYCERQDQLPEGLKAILLQQKEIYKPNGFMLLECQDMSSSYMGNLAILAFGPNNTFEEPPTYPISPRGLASDMSTIIGILPADQLDKNTIVPEFTPPPPPARKKRKR